MLDPSLPASDLDVLRREVLDRPPVAALPSNLSDHWLELIARDLEACVGEDRGSVNATYMAAPLALIIHLLTGKSGRSELRIPIEEMERYLCAYCIEINLELVSRRTEIKADPATLDTIFTSREVTGRRSG